MKHTLSSAATATGLSKSTIYRAVKSGKISSKRNEDGEYEIDPAELHRVFEPVQKHATERVMNRSETANETPDEALKQEEKQVEWFKKMLESKENQIAELNKRLEAKDAQLALPAPEKTVNKVSILFGLFRFEKVLNS